MFQNKPNVIQMYDYKEDSNGVPLYVITEYYNQQSVFHFLRLNFDKLANLKKSDLIRFEMTGIFLLSRIKRGLEQIWSNKYIHRDIKE